MDDTAENKDNDPQADIESPAEEATNKILENVPEDRKEIVRNAIHELYIQQRIEGPLPPPNFVAGYERILPGSTDRIIAMAENEQKHRHLIETSIVQAGIQYENLGIIFGFIFGAILLIGGILAILDDKQTSGLIALGTAVGALGVAFINAQRQQQAREKEKDPPDTDSG